MQVLGIELERITRDAIFNIEFPIDEWDWADIISDIEEDFDIEIPVEKDISLPNDKHFTVRDAIDLIIKLDADKAMARDIIRPEHRRDRKDEHERLGSTMMRYALLMLEVYNVWWNDLLMSHWKL